MYLHKSLYRFSVSDSVNRRTVFFCLCWIAGLLTGFFAAWKADISFLSLMRPTGMCQVSIVRLLLSTVLPFLIAAYAVNIHQFPILYFVCGLKAFCFSACGCAVARAFGSAGWLVQPMFQFSGIITAVVFCWYCIRLCILGFRWLDILIGVVICGLAAVFDYLVVSPYLAMLLYS